MLAYTDFAPRRRKLAPVPAVPEPGTALMGAFGAAVGRTLHTEMASHQTFLEILVEQGLIGLLLFVAMAAAVIKPVRQLPLLERRLWIVVLASLAVGSMSLHLGYRKQFWFVLGLLAAQVAARPARPVAPALTGRMRPAPLNPLKPGVSVLCPPAPYNPSFSIGFRSRSILWYRSPDPYPPQTPASFELARVSRSTRTRRNARSKLRRVISVMRSSASQAMRITRRSVAAMTSAVRTLPDAPR